MGYYDEYNPQEDLRAAERDDLHLELDLETARVQKLEAQLRSLQAAQDPEGAKLAQLASELGEDVDSVRAKVKAVREAQQTPGAPDPDKLSELLDKLDPHDYEGAVRAFDQAGYQTQDSLGQTWQHGRIQRAGEPKGSTEEMYAYLDAATSLEDYQARLRSVGLLENGAA
jgi:hypothetical protein